MTGLFDLSTGHIGILGNEQAARLARQASSQAFVGPEPALPISHTVVTMAIRTGYTSKVINDGRV